METMYCSKYALTGGITEHKGKRTSDGKRFEPEGWSCTYWTIGRDVHETRDAACAAAEAMRQKKLVSLEKQIHKLRKASFAI